MKTIGILIVSAFLMLSLQSSYTLEYSDCKSKETTSCDKSKEKSETGCDKSKTKSCDKTKK